MSAQEINRAYAIASRDAGFMKFFQKHSTALKAVGLSVREAAPLVSLLGAGAAVAKLGQILKSMNRGKSSLSLESFVR